MVQKLFCVKIMRELGLICNKILEEQEQTLFIPTITMMLY